MEVMALILQCDVTPSLKSYQESRMEADLILAFDKQMFSRYLDTAQTNGEGVMGKKVSVMMSLGLYGGTCSLCVWVAFLWGLWFLPTYQKICQSIDWLC